MVNVKEQQGGAIYQCGECRLWYQEKAIAEKCQAWCAKNKSCNLDIIKYAIVEEGGKKAE